MSGSERPHGRVLDAVRSNSITLVEIHDAKFQAFDQSPYAIGTQGLRGCFVVLIGSRYGAIMAHIGPTGLDVDMEKVKSLYAAEKDTHFANGEVWIVAGEVISNSQIVRAVDGAKKTIIEKLAEMGFSTPQRSGYSFHWYSGGDSPEFADKGTVFAGLIDGKRQAWVENRLLHEWQ